MTLVSVIDVAAGVGSVGRSAIAAPTLAAVVAELRSALFQQ